MIEKPQDDIVGYVQTFCAQILHSVTAQTSRFTLAHFSLKYIFTEYCYTGYYHLSQLSFVVVMLLCCSHQQLNL